MLKIIINQRFDGDYRFIIILINTQEEMPNQIDWLNFFTKDILIKYININSK